MSVSKRVRFEVLRRDNHTCQYCGGIAPDYVLTVDHVVPVALGGTDAPDNLVAACRDCNAGKTSIQPDSPLVKQVSDHAATYALGLLDRMTHIKSDLQDQLVERDYFRDVWHCWEKGGKPVELPPDWKSSVDRWHRMGVPRELYVDAIEIAMNKRGLVGAYGEFAYMAGVIWGRINEHDIDYSLTVHTAAVWTDLQLRNRTYDARQAGYESGFNDGQIFAASAIQNQDLVALMCDGFVDHWAVAKMKQARRAS